MKYNINSSLLIIAVVTGFSSCSINSNYSKPNQPVGYPKDFINASSVFGRDTGQLAKWNSIYKDTVLTRLIQLALDSNRSLLTLGTSIEQASLIASNVNANLYPSFGYNLQAGTANVGNQAAKTGTAIKGGVFRALGAVNWELDIWGKIRSASKAALADLLSVQENRNAIAMSLVSAVANNYFLLRDLDNRLMIATHTLAGRQESTRIISERFNKGYIAELDKLQAEQQEALAAVTIPAFNRAIQQTENAIRLLTGTFLDSVRRGLSNFDEVFVPDIPVGLPSQLLLRRPDIRAAEAAIHAEFERIGVAKANLYPSFNLTGLLGFASPQLSSLVGGDGFVASGLAGLTGPIFQNGQNKRRVQIQQSVMKGAIYQYQQTVLNAFTEVNNALVAYKTYGEEYLIRKGQKEAAKKALALSMARYDYGYTSYLEVLTQETNLFDAELAESTALQQKLSSFSDLYKAVGGGW